MALELNATLTGAPALIAWLQATSLSQSVRGPMLYPLVQIVHILGFVLLVGATAMFDLRVLGFSRVLPLRQLSRHLLPWSLAGFAMVAVAGLLLFSAHPEQYATSPLFLIKLSLITLAGLNAALFHVGVFRTVDCWDVDLPAPLAARLHALLSLGLWIAVICCGRLLAFV